MHVPAGGRWTRRGSALTLACALLGALAVCGTATAADKASKETSEKQKGPWLQLSLEGLGFPGVSAPFLDSGASMLSVDFVDDTHLLLTYSERSLVPRIADDPDEGQDDRVVAAKLVELPAGRVVAQTRWHMHDHSRYLWGLGEGSFLVRIGDQLYTMSPRAALEAKDLKNVFLRTVFPARQVKPSAVVVSPDGGLVTLETVVKTATSTGQTIVVLGDTDTPVSGRQGTKTLIDFYRLKREGGALEVSPAGSLGAAVPLLLPLDADGLLWAQQSANDIWSLTFDSFSGKTVQAGKVQSSCMPRLQMLDRSEFLSLSCRGADDRMKMASYGLDGKETWEEDEGDFGVPTFAFAPAAARFAVSHIDQGQVPVTAGQPGIPARQEVRVYQNASGDLLLKAECTPIVKSAENFDLSADGTLVVVVRNGALGVYKLPPLTGHDREDMAEAAKFAPPPVTEGVVRLTRLTGGTAASAPALPPQQPSPISAQAADPLQTTQQPTRRKPPTFLEPGEKPEFGTPNEPPPPR